MIAARSLRLAALAAACLPATLHAQRCENLAKRSSPATSIVVAQTVGAGTWEAGTAVEPAGRAQPLADLPAFCRVVARLTPTPDSDIQAEIWLPVSNWNGRFLAVGSGGWGGSIYHEGMADALRRGYATSATDDGHSGRGASFLLGHPEKFVDFAYRAEREMTVAAKALIQAYYSRAARRSYWNGCSGGGREGLLQASRYPNEFDGIVAGDPADVRRNAWALWLAVQTFKEPAARIPPEKYPMIHRAVLEACDAGDGLKDGLISDPESCQFDFKSLECRAGDGPGCLTPRQVQSARTLTSPATGPSGNAIFPRLEPGAELGWGRLAGGPEPVDLFLDEFRYVVYQDAHWDWRNFDLERDAAHAHAVDRNVDELDPHLAAFARHGGKLLIYHGWADQQVAPGSSVEFYKSVLEASDAPAQAANWIRLFMVPGMQHCSGGEGPDTFDALSVIEQWVEKGKAPAQIIAAHRTSGTVDRTRPLCPYPQVARYDGSGSIDAAASFTCRQPTVARATPASAH